MGDLVPWHVEGDYVEACNCEAVCPCRSQDGRDGGTSTYGTCDFVLSWAIRTGRAGDTPLDGLAVVLAGRYVDDPAHLDELPLGAWEVVLYVDDRAKPAQHAALRDIFLGRAGGTALENFAAAIERVHAVRSASISLGDGPRGPWFRAGDRVEVRLGEPVVTDGTVACAIPGLDRPGQEWRADMMRLDEDALAWTVAGRCAFATGFLYSAG